MNNKKESLFSPEVIEKLRELSWQDEWEKTEKPALIAKYRLIFDNIKDKTYYKWARDDIKKYWDAVEFWIYEAWLTIDEFFDLWDKLWNNGIVPKENYYSKMQLKKLKATSELYKAEVIDIINKK
jgi:hypothetical protein